MTGVSSSARYERQILLVGERGQAAIEGATAFVDGGDRADVIARRYARRAGFREIAPKDASAPALDEAATHEGPSLVLAGARAALREIVRVLEASGTVL